ncbi:hypothetical protein [Bradyrhizobium sp. CER78]|uniref:hypothetical protein n=1 Tax=Bradyrhizobium sp. CER78 TaxID=3039162 RepID=UPI00244B1A82|nr:hypothetical protein [Bradyrhizobium sp. CER78]MDH2387048.1 hypothetical protein [Bradyrhizobium sp. CER78]
MNLRLLRRAIRGERIVVNRNERVVIEVRLMVHLHQRVVRHDHHLQILRTASDEPVRDRTSRRELGWLWMFEGKRLKAKCLKDGLRDGAEVSRGWGAALAVSEFGSLRWPISARSAVYCPTAACPIQKARSGFSGAGLIVAMMKLYR